mmetsp:Transcript_10025/g.21445  ORF Transcript_10025/g.21445 Transcript_10025/m.21445 type:complete len:85 (-) Transcript_10025:2949-3203(-)
MHMQQLHRYQLHQTSQPLYAKQSCCWHAHCVLNEAKRHQTTSRTDKTYATNISEMDMKDKTTGCNNCTAHLPPNRCTWGMNAPT